MLVAGLYLAVCYFLFAGEFSLHECLAAVLAWTATMSFSVRVRNSAGHGFKWSHWAWVCGRTLASAPGESLAVTCVLYRILWRRPASAVGTMLRQPFRRGGGDAADAGRRALVTFARSLAPREFVVDIPDEGDWLCVHSLSASPPRKDRNWPL